MTPASLPSPTTRRVPRRLVLRLLAVVALGSVDLGGSKAHATDAAPEFLVIVNPSNPTHTAEREFVAAAFLKRTTSWSGGQAIHPVDQRPNSAVRHSFSSQIVRRSVAAVRSYWQQRIFSGRGVPPPELDSDQAVVDYVGKYPGAIGYVSAQAKLGATRVLVVR